MANDDEILKERLKPFIDALGSRLSIRASILNNIDLLLTLKNEGYRIGDLIEISGCEYSTQTFSNVLYDATKKKDKTPKSAHQEKNTLPEKEATKTIIKEGVLKESREDWMLQTGIDISERQALRLEKNGIDTKMLNDLNLNTTLQITKYLTQLEIKNKHKD